MYTDEMRRAFRSLTPPKNFWVEVVDNEHFLSVVAKEEVFMRLLDEEKRSAIEYMVKVKKALEDNGAIVLIVREGGKPL
jgi:nucleotide-binding universal stress UspA family protein